MQIGCPSHLALLLYSASNFLYSLILEFFFFFGWGVIH